MNLHFEYTFCFKTSCLLQTDQSYSMAIHKKAIINQVLTTWYVESTFPENLSTTTPIFLQVHLIQIDTSKGVHGKKRHLSEVRCYHFKVHCSVYGWTFATVAIYYTPRL